MNKSGSDEITFMRKFTETTGIEAAVFLPPGANEYFLLFGCQTKFHDPIKDALDTEYTKDIAENVRSFLKERMDVDIWVNRMYAVARRLMGRKMLLDASKAEPERKTCSLEEKCAANVREVMREDDYIDCFRSEPRFTVPWALILMIYVILYNDVKEEVCVRMFQCVCSKFSYNFSSDTITTINSWSKDRRDIPIRFLECMCAYMVRDYLEQTRAMVTDDKPS